MNLIPLISTFITINIIIEWYLWFKCNLLFFLFTLALETGKKKFFVAIYPFGMKPIKIRARVYSKHWQRRVIFKKFSFLCWLVFFVFTEWTYSEESKSTLTKYIRDKTTQTDCHIVFLRQTGCSQRYLKSLDSERWKNTWQEVKKKNKSYVHSEKVFDLRHPEGLDIISAKVSEPLLFPLYDI